MAKNFFRKLLDKWSTEQRWFLLRQFGVVFVFAIIMTFFLEYRYFGNDGAAAWNFVFTKPLVFFYTSLIMLFFMMLIWAITGRPFISVFVTAVTIMIITYIQLAKFALRGSPLIPEDFQLASEATHLTDFVDMWSIVRLIIAIILTGVVCFLVNWLTRGVLGTGKEYRVGSVKEAWWRRVNLYVRLVIAVVAISGMMIGTEFVRHHDGKRYLDVAWLDTRFNAENQAKNYDDNGFLLGFLYNMSKVTLTAPDGYSEDTMKEIATEYNAVEEKSNVQREDPDANIIVLLNESFYDPSIIKDYYDYGNVDITPNLHRIQQKYPSGTMYSVDYGGGTANIEFEVLTGLSNYWANTVPYTDLLPKTGNIPSIATWMKNFDYQTKVIHPYVGGMYKRTIAVKNEGFDEFITQNEVHYTEKEGTSAYINDASAYKETLDTLKGSDQKQMISLITMQNHAPYDINNYDHLDYRIPEYAEQDAAKERRVANYLQTLHNSDKYLGEFIAELDKLDEKTVVLFYGDHSPGVFDLVSKSEDKSVRDLSRMTPYFVYANFEMKNANEKELPMTTPNCLTNTMMNLLDMKKPTLSYLLDVVCKESPVLTAAYYGDDGGAFKTTGLSNYEMVNYDILGGNKYWMWLANWGK